MVTVTSRRAPAKGKAAATRRELAQDLLDLYRRLGPDLDSIEAIEAELKLIAAAAGASFTEIVAKLGTVKVAPGHEAEFKGDVPVIQTEAWQSLKPAKRQQLITSGLIKIEPQWGRSSSGRVTVALLKAA